MLRLALSCGGVWLLTFEGGIQCTHRRTRFMYGNNLESSEQSLGSGEIRSSDQLVLDRPASMAVDLHGTWSWKRPLSDAQSPVHAPLKLQNRMIRTRRGEPKEAARGSANRLCRQQPPCPPAAVKDQRRSSMLLRFNGEASASRRLELRWCCGHSSNSLQGAC